MAYSDKEKQKEYQRKWFQANKEKQAKVQRDRRGGRAEFLRKYKIEQGGCSFCSEQESCCLDFHHLDPSKKEINPSRMARNTWPMARMLKELEKCIVVCSNCHRKIHAGIL